MANVSSSNGLEKRPKLRFPGFDEPYRAVKLGQISSLIKRNDPRSNAPIMMLSAGNGFIMQSDKYSRDNAGQSLKKYTLLKKGELAYNHGASKAKQFGCCYELREEEARIPYVYHCFKVQDTEYTPYVALELNNTKMDKQLKRLVSSSVRMDGLLNISYDEYMSVVVYLPAYAEQKHIADFLEKLDMRIAKQEQLIESLKKYKRGLSDTLFDRIAQSPSCKIVKLGDAFELLQNNTFSRDDLTTNPSSVQNIHYGDVLVKYGAVVNISEDTPPYIKPTIELQKFVATSYLRDGDIVFADTAEDYSVGKATEIAGANGLAVLSGLHTIPCRPLMKFHPMYLAYYFNSSLFRRQIYPLVQGTKVSSISKGELVKTSVYAPTEREQRRIASMLYLLDLRITFEEKTVNALTNARTALLQQLFI